MADFSLFVVNILIAIVSISQLIFLPYLISYDIAFEDPLRERS